MKYKGSRIRRLEAHVERLESELAELRRDVSVIKPIGPKPYIFPNETATQIGKSGGRLRINEHLG